MKWKREFLVRVAACLAALVFVCPQGSAYYYWLTYLSRNAPYNGIPARWDLSALSNKTIYFFISEQGPAGMVPNDSYQGVVSQLRMAARMWNDVETSDIRLAFGGLEAPGASQSGPGIDVVFTDDIPPGLAGQTMVATGPVATGPNGSFSPIKRAMIMLPRDITDRPSFGENFFLTAVHEFGHSLGLQHSLTSSVMSTEPTRGTTKAKPLAADDIAGISTLYPRGNFANAGSISGRVTLGSAGVNLASVVAIMANGPTISMLTNPDGTYHIDGIPAGQYYVYVHPLPPDFQLDPPIGPDGRLPANPPYFDTQFFPNTRDAQATVTVAAGRSTDGVNFSVQRRNSISLYRIQTYGFVSQVLVKPPQFTRSDGRGTLYAAGVGVSASPLLNMSVIGGGDASIAPGSLRPYPNTEYVLFDLNFTLFGADGAHHMLFSQNGETYILPAAFSVNLKPPPSITSMIASTDSTGARLVTLAGANLSTETVFLFDGQPAQLRSFDEIAGRALVAPPPALPNHRANVVALNADGQSSLFSDVPPVYTYDAADVPSLIGISSNALPAGAEAMVEITGLNTNFQDGVTRIGFGTSDVLVRRVWVVSPTHILANVAIGANALPGYDLVSVSTGVQTLTAPAGFQVQVANPRLLTVLPQIVNPDTGQTSLLAGGRALILVSNLPATATPQTVTVTLNDQPAQVQAVANGQVIFLTPGNTPTGPVVLRVRNGADAAFPVVINIDPVLTIATVQGPSGPVDATRPVRQGDPVLLTLSGVVGDEPLRVLVNGFDQGNVLTAPMPQAGYSQAQFVLTGSLAPGSYPLIVSQGSRSSGFVFLAVRQ